MLKRNFHRYHAASFFRCPMDIVQSISLGVYNAHCILYSVQCVCTSFCMFGHQKRCCVYLILFLVFICFHATFVRETTHKNGYKNGHKNAHKLEQCVPLWKRCHTVQPIKTSQNLHGLPVEIIRFIPDCSRSTSLLKKLLCRQYLIRNLDFRLDPEACFMPPHRDPLTISLSLSLSLERLCKLWTFELKSYSPNNCTFMNCTRISNRLS